MKQIFKRIFGIAEPVAAAVPVQVEPKTENNTQDKPRQPRQPRQRKPKTVKPTQSAKALATERGEPYISIVNIELEKDNIGSGAFELDWNDKFIAQLVRAGYQTKPNEPEDVIVDRWFQEICRNVLLEKFEQEQADPELRRISKKNLGQGRTEIS